MSFLQGPGQLRFLLAMVVVLHHSFPLRLGAWAVDVFFILSGYWIARMWEEKYVHARRAPLTFLLSRWSRLAPVFFVSLALTLASSHLIKHTAPLPEPFGFWVLRQLPIAGSQSAGAILPPAWSLDVEMQFYGFFAVLMTLCRGPWQRASAWLVAPLALLSLILFLQGAQSGMIGTHRSSLMIYFWLFTMGVWIHAFRLHPSSRVAGISMGTFAIVTLLLLILPSTRTSIWIQGGAEIAQSNLQAQMIVQLWWAVGAAILVPFIAWNVNQPSAPWDRQLGNWAYPLYLFHWIPRDWYYSQVDWSAPLWHNAGLLLINLTASLLGSWLILVLIDRPCDRWRAGWVKKRFAPLNPAPLATGTEST